MDVPCEGYSIGLRGTWEISNTSEWVCDSVYITVQLTGHLLIGVFQVFGELNKELDKMLRSSKKSVDLLTVKVHSSEREQAEQRHSKGLRGAIL
jgi:hypothetical protein